MCEGLELVYMFKQMSKNCGWNYQKNLIPCEEQPSAMG
jgi:hypothetical protein